MTPREPSLPPQTDAQGQAQLEPRVASTTSPKALGPSRATSYSQSNEADDERTPSNTSTNMGPDTVRGEDARQQLLYEDEDIRMTSRKELRGFYVYGWAAEVC
jgi:UMF1 family MFS transporter